MFDRMEQTNKTNSRLLHSSVIDFKDELEEKLEKAGNVVNGLTSGLSDSKTNDALNVYVSKGPNQHEEVQLGLLYNILIDQSKASQFYRDMTLVSRDGLTIVLKKTNQIIHEKWVKLQEFTHRQVLWLTREVVKNNLVGADFLCHSLMRQIAGGDISNKNIWLTESILDLFIENRNWLDKFPLLIATAVYTFLRVIDDHQATVYHSLRQREVEFCESMMREKWTECMAIGRDLVRLLQCVARIPLFEKLWRDIFFNPTSLSPSFTGIHQLMAIRTSRKFLVCRLTPDMENKIAFLTTKVKFGKHKLYQDWFQRQYLSTAESQSLRCDLIRYICGVVHPSNEILCSDIIPRWAVIGWLLTTCTSNVAASKAKLSLFYDWIFFDPERDSIMNIEPCVLVMNHSMKSHPAITATLLDFMCRIMTNFHPTLNHLVKQGIYTSLKCILEKGVLPSLSPLFDNVKLDHDLRTMVQTNFSEFCSNEVSKKETIKQMPLLPNSNTINNNSICNSNGSAKDPIDVDEESSLPSLTIDDEAAEFSEEEEETPVSEENYKTVINKYRFRPIKKDDTARAVNIQPKIDQLEGPIKECVIELQTQSGNNEAQCEAIEQLLQCFTRDSEFEQESVVATCICQILSSQFMNVFPQEPDEESIEDSISTALFVIFRNLCQTSEENPFRQSLLLLLEEMFLIQPKIGYLLLYFLRASKNYQENMSSYRDFCRSIENAKDITSSLMRDLRLCQQEDINLFTYLVPDIYTQFPNSTIGNAELLLLIVSCIDGTQLQDLVCQILQGHLLIFKKESFLSVLNASLEWETIEQYFLWQLIAAHNIPLDFLMPILPKLEFSMHSEALASLLIQLKQKSPSADLLRPLLARVCKKTDFFTISILKYWAQEYEDRLADLLHTQLVRATSSGNTPNRKRKQNQPLPDAAREREPLSTEQVLGHLEHMRQTCRNISFLTHEVIQQALQHVQLNISEATKSKFSDLLALAEDLDDIRSTRVLRAVPSRRASAAAIASSNHSGAVSEKGNSPGRTNKPKKAQHTTYDSSSTTETSEDEEIILRPKTKKRKKVITVDDDTD